MERQKFEDEWKDAFGKAEISPSENLWTNIELDLIKAESEKMKKRVLFYKLMAAASIAFAMCVAGVGAYFYKATSQSSASQIASVQNENSAVQSNQSASNEQHTVLTESKKDDHNGADKETSSGHALTTTKSKADERLNDENIVSTGAQKQNVNRKINSTKSSDTMDGVALASDNVSKAKMSDRQQSINKASHTKEGSQEGNNNNMPVYVANGNTSNSEVATDNINSNDNATHGNILKENDDKVFSLTKADVTSLLATKKVEWAAPPQQEVDPFLVMMAKLELREKELREEKPEKKKRNHDGTEKLWTSLGFAAGGFTSNTSSTNSFAATSSDQTVSPSTESGYFADAASNKYSSKASNEAVTNQCKASGVAFSLGLNVSRKVFERWVVQGGVNYLTQTSSYESNYLTNNDGVFGPMTVKQAAKGSQSGARTSVASVAPYNVTNSLQYISIPVQAGFIAIKRKVGVQVNTGVSTDLFLQSTTSAIVNDNSEKVRDSGGADSPYRAVNFSALFGTEVSYRLGSHYRLAINPGLRCPFNSIYKTDFGVKSMPLTVDVGLKFRYIFY